MAKSPSDREMIVQLCDRLTEIEKRLAEAEEQTTAIREWIQYDHAFGRSSSGYSLKIRR